jgi:hypothetical protein
MREICIPVSTAQSIAESFDLRQVIIVAWDGKNTHVVTYGGSVTDSANAAAGGNVVKKALGWPANLDTESPKVQALQARIVELEKRQFYNEPLPSGQVPELPPVPQVTPTVHVIEGTEYERGWGQRPDGYAAFTSEAAARKFIVEYDRKWNSAKHAPDEFTKYEYIGIKNCSPGFYKVVYSCDVKHFNKLSELLE